MQTMGYIAVNCPSCGREHYRSTGSGTYFMNCSCTHKWGVEVKARKTARVAHARSGYADAIPGARRNDCSVRALSAALALPYAQIEAEIAARKGFAGKDGQGGVWTHASHAVLKAHGAKLVPVRDELTQSKTGMYHYARLTIREFLRLHPVGMYALYVDGHMCAAVDGVLLDWQARPLRRVREAWRTDVEGVA